jgi:two-component system CheB/CheR fusion protein
MADDVRCQENEGEPGTGVMGSAMPMVGLGGSAGSIQPLLTFFQAMPADSGMAFVVILHLSPDHESTLPAVIQRVTTMPTAQVVDTVRVKPNCIYVISPGKALKAADGQLRVTDLHPERGTRVAVDLFFRSLADTHGSQSAVIVLSGADSDGALGIKRVKELGGLTIAQEPDEAEHSSMPRAAIQTGMVDWVLPVAEMPGRLMEYYQMAGRLKLPPEEGPPPEQPARRAATEGEAAETALREVLGLLRTRTGRDFSYYKRATILRRISRRMQVNGIDDLPGYLSQLRTHPGEAGALLQDLLISVTNFFRDREAYEALAAHVPELFRGKGPNECVRAWVPACASGEEAYSIAMLLAEHARTLEAPPVIQVFATDLDEGAISVARTGVYPFTIGTDVSEERLRRFFAPGHRGYQVRQELRETVLFACHDLLRDSPFSRMDLVSCRNLLIYLNREAQERAFDIFAFALWPEGRLFLGTSESIEDASPQFATLDKKYRIYINRSATRPVFPIPTGQGLLARALQTPDQPRAAGVLASRLGNLGLPPRTEEERGSWSELHLKLIERLGPPSLVVDKDYDIVHLSENAGRYLQIGAGELKRNLLALVNPTLRVELRAALFQAAQSNGPVDIHGVPVEMEGQRMAVNIRVRPGGDLAPDYLLVTFEAKEEADEESKGAVLLKPEAEMVTRHLEGEIDAMKAQLRETMEQSEASTEELKASNEELQAMNEELRSATEELETSREELQSINEELTTVNQELKCRLDELSHANSDLHNLMVSTAIPTIFLNRELQIMRYTPSAAPIFNLIATDVGRPLSDLKHRLEYPGLEEDAGNVLARGASMEREIEDVTERRWYLTRLLPYRTVEGEVRGVVLTLVDITESKRAAAALERSKAELAAELKANKQGEEALRKSEARFRTLVAQAKAGIVETDVERRFTYVNDRFCEMTGRSREELLDQCMQDVVYPEDFAGNGRLFERLVATGEPFDVEERFVRPDGSYVWVLKNVAPIFNESQEVVGIGTIATDIDTRKAAELERKRFTEELEQSRTQVWEALIENEDVRKELEAASKAKDNFLAVLSHELRTPLTPVLMATRILERRADLAADLRESMEMIRRNVQIEAQMIDDLLDITRIERGKLEIAREPVDLHGMIQHAISIMDGELQERKQRLVVELNAEESEVLGDAIRLQQVMWNLIKNASKFSADEGEIRLKSWNESGRIFVSVEDKGIGIEAGALESIFDPFRQESLEVTRKYGGLGLGLAIAKATVEAHGGRLRAESAGRGAGATLAMELRLKGAG